MLRSLSSLILLLLAGPLFAAGEGQLMDVELDQSPEALQRGAKLVYSVCMSCHKLKYVRWRNLEDIGMSQEDIDTLRGDEEIMASMLSRSDDDTMKLSFGLVPPDLSLVAKARKGGGNYIYTLFNSYQLNEAGELENKLFPGIRMPDVLGFSEVSDDKARAELDRNIRDVASFLVWASDPHAQTRRTIGVWVMVYLVILTLLLWLYKRRVWSDLK